MQKQEKMPATATTQSRGMTTVPMYGKCAIGGIGGMSASMFIQPMDFLKVRMQLSGEGGAKRDHLNSFQAIKSIVRNEGFFSLYSGLTANLFRQATYTTSRLAIYQAIMEELNSVGYEGLPIQIGSATVAGFFGAIFSTPADVALVRMSADGRLPAVERRNYNHVFAALNRIGAEEGIRGLWKGVEPTILRAIVSNIAQLVTYTQTKQFLLRNKYMDDNIPCHFVSSLAAGFAYAGASNPVDMAKTRIQTMKTADGKPLYSGLLNVWQKTIQTEGFFALWKGFVPYYARVAPHTILLFIFCERLTILYKRHVMGLTDVRGL